MCLGGKMFGHQDDQNVDPLIDDSQPQVDNTSSLANANSQSGSAQPIVLEPTNTSSAKPNTMHDSPSADPTSPTATVDGDTSANKPTITLTNHTMTPSSTPPNDDTNPAVDTADNNTTHDLLDVKHKALDQLSPLVEKLDQLPEDRFRTLMMMIQASDDQSLIPSAFEAAQTITDEKDRAQALLDIVNEINYFTQQGAS